MFVFGYFKQMEIHCKTPSTKQPSPAGWTETKRRRKKLDEDARVRPLPL